MQTNPTPDLLALQSGEDFFLRAVAALDDDALDAPSLLAGWSRRHVIAHVSRNADALRNLLLWARTGEETPMYASPESRATDIDKTATLDSAALRHDADTASRSLLEAAQALEPGSWITEVRTARGRLIPVSDVTWMRARETWIHAVDLDGEATFEDLPEAILLRLVDEVISGLPAGALPPTVVRTAGQSWSIGAGRKVFVVVEAPPAPIVAWLTGRADAAAVGGGPRIPDWL